MDCSPPGSSIHGIFQARVLECVAISFSRGSSWPRDRNWVSYIGGRCFTTWATKEAQETLSSVQLSCSVVSDSLWPDELQHARPPCPSPTPRVHPNPCPLSRWCHPAISSSVGPFSSCPQPFPASGSFPISHLFPSWPKYCSFSFNISPFNEHPGLISSRMDWLDLLAVQGTVKSLLQH